MIGCFLGLALADEPAVEPPPMSEPLGQVMEEELLATHNRRRRSQQIAAMSVLVGWGAGNIAVGAGGWAIADSVEWRSFHQMSVGWGAINLGISVPALVGALREDPASFDMRRTLRQSTGLRVSFAINTGLDVGYVALGAWMNERGLRTDDDRLIGVGQSIMMQGAFLLVFDLTMWMVRTADDHQLLLSPLLDPQRGMVGLSGSF